MRANVRTLRRDEDTCRIPCFKQGLVRKLQQHMPSDDTLERAQTIFGALADRARIKILYALRDGEELCVCDVAHVLDVSISTASHHLRKIAGLEAPSLP